MSKALIVGAGISLLSMLLPLRASEVTVAWQMVEDRKSVIGTVEPTHELTARARIGGVVTVLQTIEGQEVIAGAVLAVIADQKLVLQIKGIEARIQSQEAQRDQARADCERMQDLLRRNVGSQLQVDQFKTALDVAERILTGLMADRDVIKQQISEGTVLAPAAGRVLTVPIVDGGVVMAGEAVATLAVDHYILRLQLPERHARFLRVGDRVEIAGRGTAEQTTDTGTVRIVYPEIKGGRVIADVAVATLDGYFVGEKTRVIIATGQRRSMLVPATALVRRAGLDFVRLKSGVEVMVQTGERRRENIEILAGLQVGDVVIAP